MHEIIYVSEGTEALTSADLFTIIEQSSRNNPGADITGFLIYRAGRFLQLVEGPLANLEVLLAKLQGDPRHRNLRVLSRRPIAERSYPRWRMKRIGESGDGAAELEDALREEGRGLHVPEAVAVFLRTPVTA